jgi:23S rRNA (guanosine2251-2'-O)-methyltransferase
MTQPGGRRGKGRSSHRPPSSQAGRSRSPAAAPSDDRPRRQTGLGGEQVEGRRAVRELLAARRRPTREVWLADGIEEAPILTELLDLAAEQGVPVRRVARGRLDAQARTDAPQGVLAHAAPLPEVTLDELVVASVPGGPAPFLLVLDGVTDPHNLGSLLRSAECAGATGVVLNRHRAVHVTPTVAKVAAGAIERLPIAVVPGTPAALAELAKAGVWVVGLDRAGPVRLWDLELATAPVALVVGAEGRGLSRLAAARCDVIVTIPEQGAIESLNVAAAGAVACFEVARRRA